MGRFGNVNIKRFSVDNGLLTGLVHGGDVIEQKLGRRQSILLSAELAKTAEARIKPARPAMLFSANFLIKTFAFH